MWRRGGVEAAFVVALALAFVLAGQAPISASAAQIGIPATIQNFLGLGTTQGSCLFPLPQGQTEPPGCVTTGDPPDTVGAAGPNNYVELDNGGIGIFDKSGNLLQTPVFLNTIWHGYPTTDGNSCAAGIHDTPAGNSGDPIVRYDQLANRWLVSEFNIPNYTTNGGPSFECVAVSQTSDPTGAWNLYDFKYTVAINDYPKFGIWPDGYYVTYNEFGTSSFIDSRICALDRTAMLAGQAASQVCATSNTFGLLPANVDGPIPPPSGTPELVAALGTDSIALFKFSVNWATKTGTLSSPTYLPVTHFADACNGGYCITQPSPGNQLESLGDRLMDRLVYRNFGTHESLLLNHSITVGTAVGVRWYEVRDPGGTPSLFQQGTYAPNDGSFRWMGSIAMDQAGDIALGYSLSSSTIKPSIAYTGRLASDPAGQMAQGEGTIFTGLGVETGTFGGSNPANRWGDYSSMTVDPSDDCTFWYANEVYPANGIFNWDTHVASFKFPNCAANDFSLVPSPATVAVPPGGSNHVTIPTTLTKGTAETVVLSAFDLPPGVTAGFSPTSVTAGGSSTLTFTAAADAPLGTYTVQLVGTAPSALHGTTVTVVVAPTHMLAVSKSGTGSGTVTSDPAGIDCGSTCSNQFADGTPVTLTATPATGSVFTGWSGDCSTDPCQLTIDADKTVTATFALQTKTLSVSTAGSGSGSVSSNPAGIDCGSTCAHAYDYGTSVTLTATPAAGSVFAGWSGDCAGTDPCPLTMDAAKTVTATFASIPEALIVATAGSGSGSVSSSPGGIDCGSTCTHDYAYGASVTLTAAPATGSTFTGWSGACAGTGGCTVSMTEARSVTATFDLQTRTLTVTKSGSGSGSVSSSPAGISCGASCNHDYAYATSVTLTATADAGDAFTGWSGACSGTGACTVSMTEAQSVTATFVAPECVVPKLKGKTLARARKALITAHCALGKVKKAASTTKAGLVIAQSPRPGKHLADGAKVNVTLSKGKK
jgi:hypothetical protein